MSTNYGSVKLRNGNLVRVEAYGAAGVVKIEDGIGGEIIALDEADDVDELIAALELAKDHVWL